jgi:putative ABC transport system permease protein
MLRVTLSGVRGHLLRFLLTAASVMLGVAFVAGTFVLTDSLQSTFDKIVSGGTAGVDALVRGRSLGDTGDGNGALRAPLPIALTRQIAAVDGVASADPELMGAAVLVGRDGTAVRNGGAPSFGVALRPGDPALRLVGGRAPTSSTEVAVETSTLARSGWSVGDRTRLVVAGRVQPVTVVGEVRLDSGSAGATFVALDAASAQRDFAPDGTVEAIDVRADPGVGQQALVDRVRPLLPRGAEALTGSAYADQQRSAIATGLGFVNTFLLVFAGISLLVGSFIIVNTFTVLVAQRTRELALLRAVGASRRQVAGVVLGEAAVIGLLGGGLGLGGGIGLAYGLQRLVGSFGLQISGLPVHPRTIALSLAIGVVVTTASAVLPALRAGRIAPVAAMRDDVSMPARSLRVRAVVGGLLVVAGSAVALASGLGDPGARAAAGVGVGALLAFVGLVVVAPVLARPVVRVLALPFTRFSRTTGRIARDNTLRNPRRTSTTAVSLMIGLTLVSAFSVVAATSKASVDRLVDNEVVADFVLSGGNSSFPATVVTDAAGLPGIAAVVDQSVVPVTVGGRQIAAAAVQGAGLLQTVRLIVPSGDLASLDRGQVALSVDEAARLGVRVGSSLRATVGVLAERTFVVGAVFTPSQVVGNDVLVPRSIYRAAVPQARQSVFAAFVRMAPGADATAVRADLTRLVAPQLVVSVLDREQFKASASSQIDQVLGILYGLLGLSVVIAALGIVNTLALSVFERTREIGLLRAIGLTRGQLRRTIATEAVLTALFGAVLGTALGLSLGVLLQRVLRDQGLASLAVPWTQVLLTFVLAGLVGVLAALWPAWRAARLDVVRAVSAD